MGGRVLNFDDEWVLIIGALGGIGSAMCSWLQEHSTAKFMLCDINRARLEARGKEMRAAGKEVRVYAVDLVDVEGRMQLFEAVTAQGSVYAVIYGAGLTYFGATVSAGFEQFCRIEAVNYVAPMHLTLLFNEYFQREGRGGILLINSLACKAYFPFQNVYAATKAALDRFVRALRYENNSAYGRGSRVVIAQIYPGPVATNMTYNSVIYKNISALQKKFVVSPEVIARRAMRAFGKGTPYIYQRDLIVTLGRVAYYICGNLVGRQLGRTYRKLVSSVPISK